MVWLELDRSSAKCVKPGLVLVLTVSETIRSPIVRDSLQKQLARKGFIVALPPKANAVTELVVMKKIMKTGEILSFGKWGVIICAILCL